MRRHTVEVLQRPADSGQFLDALLHAGSGIEDRVALSTRTADGWDELTYGDLSRHSDGVAARLRARGVEPGDRVVLAAEPGGLWVAGLLGVLRRGAVAVPLDPGLTPSEMEPMVARSAPAAVLTEDAFGPCDPAEDDTGGRHPRAAEDPAMVVWTSGTTGAPKGVTLTFANIAYVVEQVLSGHEPKADDRWLSVLPAHHLLELCCGLLPALASGASVWFARTLMPHEIGAIARQHRITKMVAVPLLLRLLEPVLQESGLPTIYCGGAPLAPGVVEHYASLGISVYPGYGLTETAPTVAMNTPEHHRSGSVGRPLPGTEVRIEAPPGAAEGEILVRSPAVMQGYWCDDTLTAATIDAQGWLRTGDLGFLDEDGYLFVTGRSKRLVVLESGKKVQPEEVEGAIGASDQFAEVCVVGIRVARAGANSTTATTPVLPASEQVCAVVVPTAAMTADHPDATALHEAAVAEVTRRTSALSGYKRPTVVKVHQGPLPRTAKSTPRHTEVAAMVESGTL